jgi:hypothetical protein
MKHSIDFIFAARIIYNIAIATAKRMSCMKKRTDLIYDPR